MAIALLLCVAKRMLLLQWVQADGAPFMWGGNARVGRRIEGRGHSRDEEGTGVDQEGGGKPKAKEKGKGQRGARVNTYIPPTKPGPVLPDPLDVTGPAHWPPPGLLVVLWSLGKKAEVTNVHALEDLQAHQVERCVNDDAVLYAVTDMLLVRVRYVAKSCSCGDH